MLEVRALRRTARSVRVLCQPEAAIDALPQQSSPARSRRTNTAPQIASCLGTAFEKVLVYNGRVGSTQRPEQGLEARERAGALFGVGLEGEPVKLYSIQNEQSEGPADGAGGKVPRSAADDVTSAFGTDRERPC